MKKQKRTRRLWRLRRRHETNRHTGQSANGELQSDERPEQKQVAPETENWEDIQNVLVELLQVKCALFELRCRSFPERIQDIKKGHGYGGQRSGNNDKNDGENKMDKKWVPTNIAGCLLVLKWKHERIDKNGFWRKYIPPQRWHG